MSKDWMPPLPKDLLDHFVGWHGRAGAEKMMHDYALAAVEAYKASLKPVAYMNTEKPYPLLSLVSWTRLNKFNVPLYRLDGGDDE